MVGARRYTLGGPTQQKVRIRCPISQGVIDNGAKNYPINIALGNKKRHIKNT